MKGQLSFWDCLHVREILSDPVLLRLWLMDGDKAKYVFVSVDGKITFGRTQYSWLNWIFKDKKEISFTDFALKTASALAGQAKNRNYRIFREIADVVLEKAIADNNYSYVVDALFDTFRHGWENSANPSKFMNLGDKMPNSNTKKNINVEVEIPDLPKHRERTHRLDGLERIGEVRLNSGQVLGKVVCQYTIQE